MYINTSSQFGLIGLFNDDFLVSPVDYPPPLSDQFLVLLVDMIKSQMDIMEPLGLTQKEVERVMASNRYKGLDEKLLKVCNDPFEFSAKIKM